ncbi:hypothetical protein [Variovorax sp. KK3]|uniref:hypothetical protein n=1 Tax=Variovorax sp. KK3 TaxID=1855728 RepID=UPI00117E7F9D|nr:hypothetical protein [Variovorax sp. KK3]
MPEEAPRSDTSNEGPRHDPSPWARRALYFCSTCFFIVAIGSLGAVAATVIRSMLGENTTLVGVQTVIFVAVLAAGFGYFLMRAGQNIEATTTGNALPDDARRLLGSVIEHSADPIGDWTKLVGLTGGTGVFRKLELSGMPLATILMTILFCLLGLAAPVFPDLLSTAGKTGPRAPFDGAATIFLDMAKLTLGAFIGSFVTKSTSRDAEATKAGAVAAAKAVAGSSPPPAPPQQVSKAPEPQAPLAAPNPGATT